MELKHNSNPIEVDKIIRSYFPKQGCDYVDYKEGKTANEVTYHAQYLLNSAIWPMRVYKDSYAVYKGLITASNDKRVRFIAVVYRISADKYEATYCYSLGGI